MPRGVKKDSVENANISTATKRPYNRKAKSTVIEKHVANEPVGIASVASDLVEGMVSDLTPVSSEPVANETAPKAKRPYHRKTKETTVDQPVAKQPVESAPMVNTVAEQPVSFTPSVRKPYPSITLRIQMVNNEIARLTKLNASRDALVKQTSKLLQSRQEALRKSEADLAKAVSKKEKLEKARDKGSVVKKEKLSPEELQARRLEALQKARESKAAKKEARQAEDAKYQELVSMLKASGRSVDDVIGELKGQQDTDVEDKRVSDVLAEQSTEE